MILEILSRASPVTPLASTATVVALLIVVNCDAVENRSVVVAINEPSLSAASAAANTDGASANAA